MILTIINISIISVVWHLITQNGEVLDFVPKLVQGITFNQKINKMLYACAKCVAGQIALWYSIWHFVQCHELQQFLLIPYSILLTLLIEKILK